MVAPEEKYEIHRVVEEAALVCTNIGEHRIAVYVTLTSPIMREQLLHHEGGNRSCLPWLLYHNTRMCISLFNGPCTDVVNTILFTFYIFKKIIFQVLHHILIYIPSHLYIGSIQRLHTIWKVYIFITNL